MKVTEGYRRLSFPLLRALKACFRLRFALGFASLDLPSSSSVAACLARSQELLQAQDTSPFVRRKSHKSQKGKLGRVAWGILCRPCSSLIRQGDRVHESLEPLKGAAVRRKRRQRQRGVGYSEEHFAELLQGGSASRELWLLLLSLDAAPGISLWCCSTSDRSGDGRARRFRRSRLHFPEALESQSQVKVLLQNAVKLLCRYRFAFKAFASGECLGCPETSSRLSERAPKDQT